MVRYPAIDGKKEREDKEMANGIVDGTATIGKWSRITMQSDGDEIPYLYCAKLAMTAPNDAFDIALVSLASPPDCPDQWSAEIACSTGKRQSIIFDEHFDTPQQAMAWVKTRVRYMENLAVKKGGTTGEPDNIQVAG